MLYDEMQVVLILTSKYDSHPNTVINLMRERDIPFFRLNTDALMTDYEFTWYSDNDKEEIEFKNLLNGDVLRGNQIKSIWCRRPEKPSQLRFENTQYIDESNLKESQAFFRSMMRYFSDWYSIGNFLHDSYASSKLVQLRLAAKLGMKIPVTCMTNTKEGVERIAERFHEIILKPFSAGGIPIDSERYITFYATKVNSNELVKQPVDAFTQTVNFCENYVPKAYEVRVTVMGPHIFPCKLDSQKQKENEGKTDWRQGYDYGLKHEMIKMPKEVEEFCRQYLHALNLNFGCFDFIVRPDGEYVFLECNSNGQWRWIEDRLGITSMSEAMLDCLVNCLPV